MPRADRLVDSAAATLRILKGQSLNAAQDFQNDVENHHWHSWIIQQARRIETEELVASSEFQSASGHEEFKSYVQEFEDYKIEKINKAKKQKYCDICKKHVNENYFEKHIKTKLHKNNQDKKYK